MKVFGQYIDITPWHRLVIHVALGALGLVWWEACQPPVRNTKEDVLLARVYNQELYLSEVQDMIPPGLSAEDSLEMIEAFIDRWVREAVLMEEAERAIPKNLNIDKLVRDYRASLIRHNYEKRLVAQLLDSVVTDREIEAFFAQAKEQFRLDEPIVRAHFIKAPISAPRLDEVDAWWAAGDSTAWNKLQLWAQGWAQVAMLSDSAWHKYSELVAAMPPGMVDDHDPSRPPEFIRDEEGYRYYFRLLEWYPAGQIPPISYVHDKVKRTILHRRKQQLLDEVREQMYQKAVRHNDVEVFFQWE